MGLVPGKLLLAFTYKISWLYFLEITRGKKGRFGPYEYVSLQYKHHQKEGQFTQIQISVAGNKYQNIITGPQYKTSTPPGPPALLHPHHPLAATTSTAGLPVDSDVQNICKPPGTVARHSLCSIRRTAVCCLQITWGSLPVSVPDGEQS